MGMPEPRPKQECITRWNSTFHMLKQILVSKDAVSFTLAVINAPVDPLSQAEWEVLQEACTVLEPLEQVKVEISADKYSVQILSHHRCYCCYYSMIIILFISCCCIFGMEIRLDMNENNNLYC